MSREHLFAEVPPRRAPASNGGHQRRIRLGLERFRQLAAAGYHYIPVYSEQPYDLENPAAFFTRLTEGKGRFLLESFEQGHQRSRYSFIGWTPLLTMKASGDEFTVMEKNRVTVSKGDPLTELKKKLDGLESPPYRNLAPFMGARSDISVTITSARFKSFRIEPGR